MRVSGFLILLLVLSACHHPNPVFRANIGHVHRVVILGNSIVACPPIPDKGWNNSWGMAASAAERDFVHLLIDSIHARHPDVAIAFRNVSGFELRYRNYDLHALDSFRGADLYILKLAENVPDTATDFIPFYDRLIRYLDTAGGVKVIMDGFWGNPINDPLARYAREQKYPFIPLDDLSRDTSMEARSLFADRGVGVHPGDKGMQAIAKRIWDYIQVYF